MVWNNPLLQFAQIGNEFPREKSGEVKLMNILFNFWI